MSYSINTINTTCDMSQNGLDQFDYTFLDASAGNITVTLPSLYQGSFLQLHRKDTNSNTVTLIPQSGQFINGTSSLIFPINRYAQCIKVDDNNWIIPRLSFN